MSQIEYYTKNVKIANGKGYEDSVNADIMKESTDGFELVNILQRQDEGSTLTGAKMIFKKNLEIIHVDFELDDKEDIPDRYMTAQQIELIKSIGKIEIDCVVYKVDNVSIHYISEDENLFVTIKLISE